MIREVWEIRETGRLGKIFTCCRSVKRWQGEHVGSQRIEKLGTWEVQEFGRLGRLEGFGDWEIWENQEIREIRKIGIFGRVGISGVGNLVEWEIWEIGKNRHMWRK